MQFILPNSGTTYAAYLKRGSKLLVLEIQMVQDNKFYWAWLCGRCKSILSHRVALLDSPSTTSSTTYQLFVKNDNTLLVF